MPFAVRLRVSTPLATALALLAGAAGAEETEPPPFQCPPGTELRTTSSHFPAGSLAAALAPARSTKWCAVPGGKRELRRGPYLATDSQGNWLEFGEYEPRPQGYDRMTGIWHYRKRGACGDWIEWKVGYGAGFGVRNAAHGAAGEVECGWGRKRRVGSIAQAYKLRCHRGDERGALDGPAWDWYENGAPRMQQHFADGTREGAFRAWYSNGRPRWEGEFRAGREHGPWQHFDCEGRLRCQGTAREGRIDGGWQCTSGETPPASGWLEEP